MSRVLKQLVADFRLVRETPSPSAWGLAEVRLQKLLKAIDALPDVDVPSADFRAVFEADLRDEHCRVQNLRCVFDIADALAAYDRARGRK